ncbi:hypothetical protein A3C96_03975 [Candidatus Uhrbacteria bacterium RIFCSPHIGHO2_02_FULL_60_10]|uniref:Glycosyl transferase family 1 n=1 Tax=Candidatus Uhrbacteria bacterium RIFCSPHIGHO2_02_FULL_60_10 TaxID=1802392 RepID=A0A1F7U2I2_9BACT|nr:MAG: hypothetical protein A3C96_03975 [Candidatus Uhrbacteria bacterium RIFCSPHIGHO2_02_FULL_60_10]
MRIGIDARFYGPAGRGLGRYLSELIAELERQDQTNEYVVFLRHANWNDYRPQNPRFSKALADIPWYGWREQIFLPPLLRRRRLDLVHFPHFNVPLLYRRPFVVTIHDLILLKYPTPRASFLGPIIFWLKYKVYRLVIASALRRARTVITVSQTTKQDLEQTFPFAKQKNIIVTHEASAGNFSAPDSPPATRHSSLATPYFLYVGSAYPHKNLETLLAAFVRFRANHPEYRLVIVGAHDRFMTRLMNEARAHGRDRQVEFRGAVSDSELARLYDEAIAYVFPSLCEGFGLPPLEAMSRGLPVAAARASCLPEILGDAAVYFDPQNPVAIAAALSELAENPDKRSVLATAGRAQAGRYNWSDCARKTLAAYRSSIPSSLS